LKVDEYVESSSGPSAHTLAYPYKEVVPARRALAKVYALVIFRRQTDLKREELTNESADVFKAACC
jgi:hypothetical protein